jgi:hypothetical protein
VSSKKTRQKGKHEDKGKIIEKLEAGVPVASIID